MQARRAASGAVPPPVLVLATEQVVTDRFTWHLDLHPSLVLRGRRRLRELSPGPTGGGWDVAGLVDVLSTPPPVAGASGVAVCGPPGAEDRAALAEALGELGAVVIHLRHPNVVRDGLARAARSSLRRSTGRSAPTLPSHVPDWPFDGHAFTKHLRRAEIAQKALGEFVRELAVPCVQVDDDDVLDAEIETMNGVFDQLGVGPLPFRPRLPPYGDDVLLRLTELERLRGHLEGTAYPPMLEELERRAGIRA